MTGSVQISLLYVEQYPDEAIAYNDAALSYIFMNDLKTAKTYLQKGYELNPSDMLLHRKYLDGIFLSPDHPFCKENTLSQTLLLQVPGLTPSNAKTLKHFYTGSRRLPHQA